MIKNLALLFLATFLLASCNNDKQQEKDLLNQVIKVHDKIMNDDETVMKNKTVLDTIALYQPATKDSVAIYKKQLDSADNVMMDWMNKFNPDYTGKSHADVMNYLNKQKEEIGKIDSLLSHTIAESGHYIKSKGK